MEYCHSAKRVVETESICGKHDLSCRGKQEILSSSKKQLFSSAENGEKK